MRHVEYNALANQLLKWVLVRLRGIEVEEYVPFLPASAAQHHTGAGAGIDNMNILALPL